MTDRRSFLKLAAKTAAVTAASTTLPRVNIASAQGKPINIGFIPLTDCASVVMAQELGYFKKYGVNVNVIKQASWAATRDGLLSGDLHAAHCLFSLPLSVYAGIGGPAGRELPSPWSSTTTVRPSRWKTPSRRPPATRKPPGRSSAGSSRRARPPPSP
ncbi:ABC transporter substrate-binding protein [Deinococcus sp. 6YEL10]|uniref:ABC transporter substrate-binding protein n=1 Tax=Deinococcus sp. 6YEL10 TaxID=2745870 RepID=UPI002103BE5F|nr:ABC transporter substrate-binding protein [Deinococcus sp. 6YEL10]